MAAFRKRRGEHTTLEREEVERHAQRVSMLEAEMLRAHEASRLPDDLATLVDELSAAGLVREADVRL